MHAEMHRETNSLDQRERVGEAVFDDTAASSSAHVLAISRAAALPSERPMTNSRPASTPCLPPAPPRLFETRFASLTERAEGRVVAGPVAPVVDDEQRHSEEVVGRGAMVSSSEAVSPSWEVDDDGRPQPGRVNLPPTEITSTRDPRTVLDARDKTRTLHFPCAPVTGPPAASVYPAPRNRHLFVPHRPRTMFTEALPFRRRNQIERCLPGPPNNPETRSNGPGYVQKKGGGGVFLSFFFFFVQFHVSGTAQGARCRH